MVGISFPTWRGERSHHTPCDEASCRERDQMNCDQMGRDRCFRLHHTECDGYLPLDGYLDRQPGFTLMEATIAAAIVSVLLVAVATWAIVACAVADRTRELGVRIALGARASVVLPRVIGRSLLAALLGIVLGAGAAWASTRALSSFLYDMSARDPRAFVAGMILLLSVVVVASYLPATRATRINPVDALRAE